MDDRFLPSTALERDHRQLDKGLAEFRAGLSNGDWGNAPFAAAAAALRRHIYLEEDVLFPALRGAGLFAPVSVMIREHGEIWRALEAIEDALGEDADVAAALAASNQLHAILEAHNVKEEQILYPAADRVLSPEVASRLQEAIEHGVRPHAWLCEALDRESDSRHQPGRR